MPAIYKGSPGSQYSCIGEKGEVVENEAWEAGTHPITHSYVGHDKEFWLSH